jgi:hypothetical protein
MSSHSENLVKAAEYQRALEASEARSHSGLTHWEASENIARLSRLKALGAAKAAGTAVHVQPSTWLEGREFGSKVMVRLATGFYRVTGKMSRHWAIENLDGKRFIVDRLEAVSLLT